MDKKLKQHLAETFKTQRIMGVVGAEISQLESGLCQLKVPFQSILSQQNGYFHGGVLGAIADTAGGYAAYTMLPIGAQVLAVEYKISFLRPASGALLIANAQVERFGRTLIFCSIELEVGEHEGGDRKGRVRCASASQTLMQIKTGQSNA